MSDVLVKGMKLPRSCFNYQEGYCRFYLLTYHGLYHCSLTGSKCLKSRRPKDCPLVEVPSHGDLIDRQKALEMLPHITERGFDEDVVSSILLSAPTVLEANE